MKIDPLTGNELQVTGTVRKFTHCIFWDDTGALFTMTETHDYRRLADTADSLSTADLLHTIETLQGVQKRNRYDSEPWQRAEKELAPLFTEMARRQAAGDPLAN